MIAVVLVALLIWVVVAMIHRDQMAGLRAEVATLRRRVTALEDTAGAGGGAAVAEPEPAPAPAPRRAPMPDNAWEAWLPTARPVDVPPVEPPSRRRPEGVWDWGPPVADTEDELPAPAPSEQPIGVAAGRDRADWERWIGTHLLAIGGGAFLLLGAAFFVKLAIADGWLTPGRQVVLAVLGGIVAAVLAVRTHDADDPARNLLGQALAAAGAGSVVVGLVAGARIYDTQVVSTPTALIGTGIAAAFMVACAWRWNAQATAALGITTALLAPPLVGATASLGSAAFVAVALLATGFVTVRRAWPWLVHAGLWLTVWQLAWWLFDQTDRFAQGTPPAGLTLGVIAAISGWWLLVAGPALLTERAGGWRV